MKKIAVGIVAVLGLTLLQAVPAKAAGETIVIVDNLFDSTRPEFKNNIVHEVCITASNFCSARLMNAEGPGAANAPASLVYRNTQSRHGTDLALVATKVNPNVRLILMRTSGISTRNQVSDINNMHLYVRHFEWIAANKDKYNIVSVVFSKDYGRNDNGSCVVKRPDQAFVQIIQRLTNMGIAVMAGTGNNGWTGRTSFPSCIKETVSVGGTMDWQPGLYSSSNLSADTDFFAVAGWNIATSRVIGTSFSNAALAAYWVKNYQGSFQKTYDYLKSIGKNDSHSRIASYTFVDVTK